jgi:hypothetical protein
MGKHSAPKGGGNIMQLTNYLGKYRKFIIAALQAALVAGFSVATNGVTVQEWGYIVLSAGAAIGVWATPNKPTVKDKNDQV